MGRWQVQAKLMVHDVVDAADAAEAADILRTRIYEASGSFSSEGTMQIGEILTRQRTQ